MAGPPHEVDVDPGSTVADLAAAFLDGVNYGASQGSVTDRTDSRRGDGINVESTLPSSGELLARAALSAMMKHEVLSWDSSNVVTNHVEANRDTGQYDPIGEPSSVLRVDATLVQGDHIIPGNYLIGDHTSHPALTQDVRDIVGGPAVAQPTRIIYEVVVDQHRPGPDYFVG